MLNLTTNQNNESNFVKNLENKYSYLLKYNTPVSSQTDLSSLDKDDCQIPPNKSQTSHTKSFHSCKSTNSLSSLPTSGVITNLSQGMPSADIIPHNLMSEALHDYFKRMEQDTSQVYQLNYELNTGGNPEQLNSVSKLYKQYKNIDVDITNLITTNAISGTVATLNNFIMRQNDQINPSFSQKKQTIYVQNPGNPQINNILEDLGIILKALNLDDDFNPNVDEFKKEIEYLKNNNLDLPSAIQIVPYLNNPTGTTFSLQSSLELVDQCISNKIQVLSDESYMLLNFEPYGDKEIQQPLYWYQKDYENKNIKSKNSDQVISMNSFSYLIVPGVRTGWIYTSKSNINKLSIFSYFSLGVANINEGMISSMIDTGKLDMAIKRIKKTLKKRRDFQYITLARMVIQGKVTFVTKNKGGYYFIIGIKSDSQNVKRCMNNQGYHIDTQEIYDISSIQQNSSETASVSSKSSKSKQSNTSNQIKISYSQSDVRNINEGLNMLDQCLT